MTRPIPITAAKKVAEDYGYDQIVIIARKTGDDGVEHMTTYGITKEHCRIAGAMGRALQKFMGWSQP